MQNRQCHPHLLRLALHNYRPGRRMPRAFSVYQKTGYRGVIKVRAMYLPESCPTRRSSMEGDLGSLQRLYGRPHISRYIFLFGILALIPAAGWVLSAAQPHWEVVVPQTLFDEKWRRAAFLDESFGLTGRPGISARRTIPGTAARPGPRPPAAADDSAPWTSWMPKRHGNAAIRTSA